MLIRAVKLRISTADGDFGFSVQFSKKLTIIRGKNSSGKSTLYNAVLYGIGMDELLGGRGENILNYAVKDWFSYEGREIPVVASEVYLEVENSSGLRRTFRRAITDPSRSSKLVEVLDGAYLTEGAPATVIASTYLFDAGAAQITEGFHHYLENFLGLRLPLVPTTSGGETKLYLQTIFAALAVEQKRGWSDYVATIPFYGISSARTKVVEYLLGLAVFEANALRNRLNVEASQIALEWTVAVSQIERAALDSGVVVGGVSQKPSPIFDPNLVELRKRNDEDGTALSTYIANLADEYKKLQEPEEIVADDAGELRRKELDAALQELHRLALLYESVAMQQTLDNGTLEEYERLLQETREDLERNNAAKKLKKLGAREDLALVKDRCPTCEQHIEDSLLLNVTPGMQMDLDTNILYLDRQRKMLDSQIQGTARSIASNTAKLSNLAVRMNEKREHLSALRADVSSDEVLSRARIKRQLQIEIEEAMLRRFELSVEKLVAELKALAQRLAQNQSARKRLPDRNYSEADEAKISLFEMNFRANAASFGYESAAIGDIKINRETLTPFLADMELRQYRKSDLRGDSSASDFIRLIWSYLLALYQTSSHNSCSGNHPGFLMFDEPGQHSMAAESQRALLKLLGSTKGLQSIVAASFDENESVFMEATDGVQYDLVQWDERCIRPLAAD